MIVFLKTGRLAKKLVVHLQNDKYRKQNNHKQKALDIKVV